MPPKLHHYVPQFYLRGFEDPEKPDTVWVYEKGVLEPRSQPIKVTAAENFYYAFESPEGEKDVRLENEVLAPWEGMAAPVIRRILEDGQPSITDDDLRRLTPFLATLYVRSPRVRADTEEWWATALRLVAKDLVSDEGNTREFLASNPDWTIERLRQVTDALQDRRELEIRIKQDILVCLTFSLANDVAPFIAGRQPTILTAPREVDFVTSDSPLSVFMHHPDGTATVGAGIGQPHAEITLPLGPRIALRLSLAERRLNRGIGQAEVRDLNRRTVCQAARYVYAHKRSKWIAQLVQDFAFTRDMPRVDPERVAAVLRRARKKSRIPEGSTS